jgi:ATP citrate (pro-S)-lyase
VIDLGNNFILIKSGALDDAARQFKSAFDSNLTPSEFVTKMANEKKLIMGIGHRVKSLQNPGYFYLILDKRVTIIKEYSTKNFKDNSLLEYALKVEKITTQKKQSLILNVDGAIAVCKIIF